MCPCVPGSAKELMQSALCGLRPLFTDDCQRVPGSAIILLQGACLFVCLFVNLC